MLRDFSTRTRAPCAAVGPTRGPWRTLMLPTGALGRFGRGSEAGFATCRGISLRYPLGECVARPGFQLAPRQADIPPPSHCVAPSGRRRRGRRWRGPERNSTNGNRDIGEKFLNPIYLVGFMKCLVRDLPTIICKCGRTSSVRRSELRKNCSAFICTGSFIVRLCILRKPACAPLTIMRNGTFSIPTDQRRGPPGDLCCAPADLC